MTTFCRLHTGFLSQARPLSCYSPPHHSRVVMGTEHIKRSKAYNFQPLLDGHIRLIRLEPSRDPAADLHFSFSHGPYKKVEGDYEALSYTWGGSPSKTYPLYHISTLGIRRIVYMTANLDAALRRLRHRHDIRVLWVDAVCINQKDDKEKSTQIPLMADIYRGAGRVVAWIGPVAHDSDEEKGMRFLGHLSRHQDYLDACVQQKHKLLNDPLPLRRMGCFFSLPWFSRLWIIQEITLNIDVLLFCGSYQLSWARLAAAVGILQKKKLWEKVLTGRPHIKALKKTIDLWMQQGLVRSSDSLSNRVREPRSAFTDLMESYRDFGCADDRDRIFALYRTPGHDGIRPRSQTSFVSNMIVMLVDYSISVDETYRTFSLACFKTSGQPSSHGIMHSLLLRQYASQDSRGPSWLVDWRKKPTYPFRNSAESKFDVNYYGHLHRNMIKISPSHSAVDDPRFGYTQVTNKIERSAFTDIDHFLLAVAEAFSQMDTPDGVSKANTFAKCMKMLLRCYWPNPTQSDRVSCPIMLDVYLKDVYERHNTGVSNVSEDFEQMVEGVEEATKQLCFFQSSLPSPSSSFIGLGNDNLKKHDRIISTVPNVTVIAPGYKVYIALILRHMRTLGKDTIGEGEYDEIAEAHPHSCLEEDTTTGTVSSYRLIGSAMTVAPLMMKIPGNGITRAVWVE
ncbi:heterokaryon incompatibility protein-domain-containing protein [Paraphoma chrysanthemicola]|uniref:Heterokaryon incompatibility protein-domain-containing protein n=1 Tax=Paraphoma chrysanthemicola TaxID=798071 RepID=A0A8K0R708_9PLEO|nr:heterokaryon incompatibility protein-domain-containing protein [Paraphoma chrysanthemicola]